jgi:hypothetical protein
MIALPFVRMVDTGRRKAHCAVGQAGGDPARERPVRGARSPAAAGGTCVTGRRSPSLGFTHLPRRRATEGQGVLLDHGQKRVTATGSYAQLHLAADTRAGCSNRRPPRALGACRRTGATTPSGRTVPVPLPPSVPPEGHTELAASGGRGVVPHRCAVLQRQARRQPGPLVLLENGFPTGRFRGDFGALCPTVEDRSPSSGARNQGGLTGCQDS